MKNLIRISVVCLAFLSPSLTAAESTEAEAMAMLQSMSDYIGGLESLELAFDSDIEIITPQLEKIQFTNSGTAVFVRPDKLRAYRIGGYSDVELFYDGKTMSILGNHLDAYAQVNAPGTIDDILHAMRAGHGVALPGADLLMSDSYELLSAGIEEAKYMGRGVIDGEDCEHLAFRNFDTDWQLWIRVGNEPAPCKMVITSKTINSAPQYTLRVTSWKPGVKPPGDLFTFTAPAGHQRLDHNALIELDELPPEANKGDEQ